MRGMCLTWILLASGCGCQGSSVRGQPDTVTQDDPLVPDGPCADCDDGDPCTMDLCNTLTLECVSLPLDMDGDGHLPVECGGDDCDDGRADTHAGAPEVCLDGVDQDCDTVADGPMAMGPDIRLSEMDPPSEDTAIAWTGSGYAVAWDELDLYGSGDGDGIYLLRLDGAGAEIGPPLRLSEWGNSPALAWTGSRLALAWQGEGEDGGYYLQVALLGPGGEVETGLLDTLPAAAPTLAWTGSEIGLAAAESTSYFARLGPDATLLGDVLELAGVDVHSDRMGLAWSGSGFGACWDQEQDPPMLGWDIYFARIDASGRSVTEPARLTNAGFSFEPELAWSGSEYGIVWAYATTYFARLDALGEKVGGDVRVTGDIGGGNSRIAWTGSEYVVGWIEGPTDDSHATMGVLAPDGTTRWEGLHVSSETSEKHDLAIAWTGSEVGLAWADSRDDETPCRDPYGSAIRCNLEVYFNRVGFCQ